VDKSPPYEAVCIWPDGQRRDVMLISIVGEMASIIWNEEINTSSAKVIGFDETVPLIWIK